MRDKTTPILMLLLALLIVLINQAEAQTSDSCYPSFIVSYTPGTTKGGDMLDLPDNYDMVLGNNTDHLSLGFGGEIILGFTNPIKLGVSEDLIISEKNGIDCDSQPEKIDVYVSADGENFTKVASDFCLDGNINFPNGTAIKYIKLVDVSDPTFNGFGALANGYDLQTLTAILGCSDCTSIDAPTVAFDDATEKQCLNTNAAITLTGEGPWKVGYTNGPELAVADIANSSETIPLTLSEKTWLAWVTDNNGCTTVIDDSDTLSIAEPTEAYFRRSYAESLTDYQVCSIGEGILVPLILKGEAPWNITYTLNQSGAVETRTLSVNSTRDNDTYWWDLLELGSYQLQSVEDACGAGIVTPEIDSIKTDSLVLVELPTARFLSPDTVCNVSEEETLAVELTGVSPWELTWEVEGIEYTKSDINTSVMKIPLNLDGRFTLKSVKSAVGCEGTILADNIVEVITPVTAQLFKKSGSICNPSEKASLTVKLNGSAPFTFAYTLNGEVVDTIETEFDTYDFDVTKPGLYALAGVQNACGEGSAGGEVEVTPNYQPFNAISYELVSQSCNTVAILLQADSIFDEFQYQWFSGGKAVGQESTIQFSSTIGGNLNVSLVTSLGNCSDTVSSIIPVEALGTGNLGRFKLTNESDPTCEDQLVTLVSDSVNSAFTYQWKLDGELVGEEATLTTQLASGLHNIQMVINDGSCLYSSNQNLAVPEFSLEELADFSYNLSEEVSCTSYPINLSASSAATNLNYNWTINDEAVSQQASFSYDLTPGKYEIVLEVASGSCTSTTSQEVVIEGITLSNAGNFDFGTEVLSCNEWSLSANALDLGEELQYEWWVDGELIGEQERLSTTLSSGDHVLRLVARVGECQYEAEEIVSLTETTSLINVPNVLSPQAAHPDDQVIKVYGSCIADEEFYFQIIDRWGGVAYETKSAEDASMQGWDGGNYPAGIYTYILRGQFHNGTAFQKQGKVTLIK